MAKINWSLWLDAVLRIPHLLVKLVVMGTFLFLCVVICYLPIMVCAPDKQTQFGLWLRDRIKNLHESS